MFSFLIAGKGSKRLGVVDGKRNGKNLRSFFLAHLVASGGIWWHELLLANWNGLQDGNLYKQLWAFGTNTLSLYFWSVLMWLDFSLGQINIDKARLACRVNWQHSFGFWRRLAARHRGVEPSWASMPRQSASAITGLQTTSRSCLVSVNPWLFALCCAADLKLGRNCVSDRKVLPGFNWSRVLCASALTDLGYSWSLTPHLRTIFFSGAAKLSPRQQLVQHN